VKKTYVILEDIAVANRLDAVLVDQDLDVSALGGVTRADGKGGVVLAVLVLEMVSNVQVDGRGWTYPVCLGRQINTAIEALRQLERVAGLGSHVVDC
jgi:hypothetical protein